jgi:hypothetical protein
MSQKNIAIIGLILVLTVITVVFCAGSVYAQEGLWKGGNLATCRASGDCKLNDFAQLAVNVAQWILGITGSLSLLAFIYGGILFLTSAGSNEQVTKGRQAITGAVIGLVVVFASYMIIGFVFKALGVGLPSESAWSTTGWFKP